MRWRMLVCTLTLLLPLVPRGAQAKLCGDKVDGQAVRCACGDIVVSDLTVQEGDPVISAACKYDGLVVRAASTTPGVTIDLHGYTLRGTGRGTGLLVLGGGQGGARIVSTNGPATITGFRDGISSRGSQTVLIEGLQLIQNHRDGLMVEGTGFEIRDTEARDSGRDGFSLAGQGYHLRATRAANSRRYGYLARGQGATLGVPGAGSTSDGSGKAGFNIQGPGHHLIDCVATRSSKTGVSLHGSHYEISGCSATRNGEDGINGMGSDWKVARNVASNNGNDGVVVSGPGVTDAGGNYGTGNRGQRVHRPAVQCEINHQPCGP